MSSLSSKLFPVVLALMDCGAFSTPHYTTHEAITDTPRRVVPIAIDIRFSSAEQVELALAIAEWNVALNHQMILETYTTKFDMQDNTLSYITNSKGITMLSVSELSTPMLHIDTNIRAITCRRGEAHDIYFLKEKVNLDRVRPIALHELGHALGAFHSHSGLMSIEDRTAEHQCIDEATVMQVADANHLDFHAMNWCHYD